MDLGVYHRCMPEDIEKLYSELFETAGLGRRLGEDIAALAGQTQARWQTLWTIGNSDLRTVPQVARRMGVSRQNVQRLVSEMVAEGLVELRPNPDHKTSPHVALADAGREALATISVASEGSQQRILEHFGSGDVAALRELLQRLSVAMKLASEIAPRRRERE